MPYIDCDSMSMSQLKKLKKIAIIAIFAGAAVAGIGTYASGSNAPQHDSKAVNGSNPPACSVLTPAKQ
jgi:hypothetical protein